jgi:hypothetical protein
MRAYSSAVPSRIRVKVALAMPLLLEHRELEDLAIQRTAGGFHWRGRTRQAIAGAVAVVAGAIAYPAVASAGQPGTCVSYGSYGLQCGAGSTLRRPIFTAYYSVPT